MGCELNLARAYEYFQAAAELHSAQAMTTIADLLSGGMGLGDGLNGGNSRKEWSKVVKTDYKKAIEWLIIRFPDFSSLFFFFFFFF